jgi:hypothetical protein
MMSSKPVTNLWGLYGAMIGLLVCVWRSADSFAPWVGTGIAENLGMIAGSMFGFALIGFFAGAIRDRTERRIGRM